jgi:hypothetical protein
MFVVTAGAFSGTAINPVIPTRFNIDTAPDSNFKFWILTWETYDAKLWIGQPGGLDRETFDRITGCEDSTVPPERFPTPKWTIRLAWDESVVLHRDAVLVNPPANECSSTTGGHVLSLGKFAVSPGRYQFELKFSNDIPESMSFPVELNINCCGKLSPPHTWLGGFPLFFAFVLFPILALVFAILTLLLVTRAVLYAIARGTEYPPSRV